MQVNISLNSRAYTWNHTARLHTLPGSYRCTKLRSSNLEKKVKGRKKKSSKTLFSKFSLPQQSLLLLLLLLRLAVFRGETFDWRLCYTFASQTKTTHLNATFLASFCFLPFFAFCDDLFSSYIHGVLLPLSSQSTSTLLIYSKLFVTVWVLLTSTTINQLLVVFVCFTFLRTRHRFCHCCCCYCFRSHRYDGPRRTTFSPEPHTRNAKIPAKFPFFPL